METHQAQAQAKVITALEITHLHLITVVVEAALEAQHRQEIRQTVALELQIQLLAHL
jgi:hypothetical protein